VSGEDADDEIDHLAELQVYVQDADTVAGEWCALCVLLMVVLHAEVLLCEAVTGRVMAACFLLRELRYARMSMQSPSI
jgi:hypothetical protein